MQPSSPSDQFPSCHVASPMRGVLFEPPLLILVKLRRETVSGQLDRWLGKSSSRDMPNEGSSPRHQRREKGRSGSPIRRLQPSGDTHSYTGNKDSHAWAHLS